MWDMVGKLIEALEQAVGLLAKVSLVQDGIYRVTILGRSVRLFVYADFVENRITPSDDLPSIHLDHDILRQQFDKTVARIITLLGYGEKLHARQTVVARIDKKVAMEFQHEHHLQSVLPGKYRYGLFLDGELVSIAVFSGGRKMNDRPEDYRSFELLRFCHKNHFLVVGGLSKLIKAFQKDFDPGDVMTYVDRDWSQDSALKSLGFVEVATIPPQRYALEGNNRKSIPEVEYQNILSAPYTNSLLLKSNSGSTKMVLFFQDDRP